TACDEPTGEPTAEEVPEIRREERHPEPDQALFQREAPRDEIDREPIGDKEPDRIGKGLRHDAAPRLRQPEKRAIRQRSAASAATAAFRRPGPQCEDVRALVVGDPGVLLRTPIDGTE